MKEQSPEQAEEGGAWPWAEGTLTLHCGRQGNRKGVGVDTVTDPRVMGRAYRMISRFSP